MINPGLRFRQAAADGDRATMESIYSTHMQNSPSNLIIFETGISSGKTAAHRAAEKGHASILRLLHSLGDTFSIEDNKGNTPLQLAINKECIRVFELATLGKQALAAAALIFPKTIDEETCTAKVKKPFLSWRKLVEEKTSEKVGDITQKLVDSLKAELLEVSSKNKSLGYFSSQSEWKKCRSEWTAWMYCQNKSLVYIFSNYYKMELAIKMKQDTRACGESSASSYVYLTSEAKTDFPVDQVGLTDGISNHAFVMLDRNQNLEISDLRGWDNALIIDSFEQRSFFYENIDLVAQTSIKNEKLRKDGSLHILCSTKKNSPPATLWQPTKTIQFLQKIMSVASGITEAKFSELRNLKKETL